MTKRNIPFPELADEYDDYFRLSLDGAESENLPIVEDWWKQRARIKELEAALKPVAKWLAPDGLDDGHILMMPFTVADLRAARAAYLGEKE